MSDAASCDVYGRVDVENFHDSRVVRRSCRVSVRITRCPVRNSMCKWGLCLPALRRSHLRFTATTHVCLNDFENRERCEWCVFNGRVQVRQLN